MPHIWVTLFERINLTKLDRIHPKLLTEFLHCRFHCEVRLRTGWCTIGTGTRLVSLNYIAANIHIGTAIDATEMKATKASERIGISSRIKNHSDLYSSERTVPLRTQFDRNHRVWRGIPGQ